jgi:hypothetical protein
MARSLDPVRRAPATRDRRVSCGPAGGASRRRRGPRSRAQPMAPEVRFFGARRSSANTYVRKRDECPPPGRAKRFLANEKNETAERGLPRVLARLAGSPIVSVEAGAGFTTRPPGRMASATNRREWGWGMGGQRSFWLARHDASLGPDYWLHASPRSDARALTWSRHRGGFVVPHGSGPGCRSSREVRARRLRGAVSVNAVNGAPTRFFFFFLSSSFAANHNLGSRRRVAMA